jgi:hypothetical protein
MNTQYACSRAAHRQAATVSPMQASTTHCTAALPVIQGVVRSQRHQVTGGAAGDPHHPSTILAAPPPPPCIPVSAQTRLSRALDTAQQQQHTIKQLQTQLVTSNGSSTILQQQVSQWVQYGIPGCAGPA